MKILFLSPWFPTPANNGSKIRIYNLIKGLAKVHDVHLLSFVRGGEILDKSQIEEIVGNVNTAPWIEFNPNTIKSILAFFALKPRSVATTYSKVMEKLVDEAILQWEPDVIVASQIMTTLYVQKHHVPKIFDEFEAGIIRDIDYRMTNIASLRRRITWLKSKAYWKKMLQEFNACTVVSEIERKIVHDIAPEYKDVVVIPNGVDTQDLRPNMGKLESNRLIYSGALTYRANFDAVKYFLEKIFPLVGDTVKGVVLWVTGSTEGVNLSGLNLGENVCLTGYLEDIHPIVAEAAVCVVPLRVGGGTRLKILEAMALGTPVVSTSKGAEGLEVVHEQHLLIADEPQDFAQQVVRLLEDSELRRTLAVNGRRLVEERYDWGKIGGEFINLVEMFDKNG